MKILTAAIPSCCQQFNTRPTVKDGGI